MRAVNRIGLTLGLAGLAAACGPERHVYSSLPPLGIGFRLGLENLCTGSESPPIRIDNAPQATAAYRLRFTNVSVLLSRPRDWTIPAPSDPALVPLGALDGWTGPCPGDLQLHRYRFEALALDAAGTPLAYGVDEAVAEPVNQQAQQRWQRGRGGAAPDPTRPPDATPDFSRSRPDVHARDRDAGLFDSARERTPSALDPLGRDYLPR